MRPRFFYLLLALLASGASLVYPARAENASSRPGLSSAAVELREVDQTYPADAIVEAVRQAIIAAQVTGRIVEARYDAGSRVKAGEVLLRIDPRQTAQAEAGAQAQLANARVAYERSQQLFRQKFISQAALDKAEADFKVATANSRETELQSGFTRVTAPFAGIIAQRLVEPGELAVPGKALLSMFDPKGMRAVASIPQSRLVGIRQTIRARVEFPESGKWVDAIRVEVLPTTDSQTHVARARIYLPENLDGVVPGMYARAHFVTGKVNKLVLPAAAVLRRGEVTAVYVVDDQGQPHLRQVRIGEAANGGVGGVGGVNVPLLEVLAGVAVGEKVALDPVKAGIALKQGSR
ncbi:MAG: efflux RND transporter periplasmic adaptor subunit [Betaproteobacteria bacterium]|nr:efflux RND transporter periplasmic adaptor subunit [Betaproteobacteria bacterium]